MVLDNYIDLNYDTDTIIEKMMTEDPRNTGSVSQEPSEPPDAKPAPDVVILPEEQASGPSHAAEPGTNPDSTRHRKAVDIRTCKLLEKLLSEQQLTNALLKKQLHIFGKSKIAVNRTRIFQIFDLVYGCRLLRESLTEVLVYNYRSGALEMVSEL